MPLCQSDFAVRIQSAIPCLSEVRVPYSTILEEDMCRETTLQSVMSPRPESFDSSEEFSLEHLSQLYKLVEAENQEMCGYLVDDSYLRVA